MTEQRTLYLVGTPIGNLKDITYRAVEILGQTPVLACEDTRVTRKIFDRYEIPKPRVIFSCNEHNERHAVTTIVRHLDGGEDVAYCSDAGMPGISDPGYLLVQAARNAGHKVDVIPGPSSSISALVVSGLPSHSFTFLGFSPRKGGQRKKFIGRLGEQEDTLVFFESPYRIGAFLKDAFEVLGDRQAAVVVEQTKKFEEVSTGWLSELAEKFETKKVKGEITVVIAGNVEKFIRPASAD
ncbi:MAG: 16S rRNA (cytidine(1402)-2'-O)-methyltransferase [Nitrospinae bacterium]|nr:16S rRNA (cytidine(1402)-2'-O)-methyltransferase [Nitrospinota bacterium]